MSRFPGNQPSRIAVANVAGSAGKTTTVVSLATLLAQSGKQVLVIDLDGQANATKWLGVEEPELTTASILLKQANIEDVVTETSVEGVRLLPGDSTLLGIDQQITATPSVGRELRLKLALKQAEVYDVVLMDCPGGMNTATFSALMAADHVLSVVMPSVKEMEGIPKLEGIVEEIVEAYDSNLSLSAVIPCAVPPANAGRAYGEAMDMLRAGCPDILTPEIRRSVKVAEAYARPAPLPVHAPTADVTQDYRDVLVWLASKGIV